MQYNSRLESQLNKQFRTEISALLTPSSKSDANAGNKLGEFGFEPRMQKCHLFFGLR